jgi:putative flippase GtrA
MTGQIVSKQAVSRQALTFLGVGLLTVLIDAFTYRALQTVLPLAVAKAIGFVTGMVFAYGANRFLTFRQQPGGSGTVWRFLVLYALALCINTGLNSLVMSLTDGLADASTRLTIAFVIATGASATWNFIGMKWFVFKPQAEAMS